MHRISGYQRRPGTWPAAEVVPAAAYTVSHPVGFQRYKLPHSLGDQ